jgi:hypothetical protein
VIEQDPSDISNIYETAIDVVRRLRQRFSRNEILFVLAVAMLICCPSKEHD